MMMYSLYRFGQWMALSLPHSIAYRVGVFLTRFKYMLCRGERTAMRKNMQIILGADHEGVEKYPRLIYANFGKYLVDFFRAPKIDKEFIEKFVTIENISNMDEALTRGKGVLGLTAHIGNWELCAQIMALLGYKINAIALTHSNKQIDDFFTKQREDKGVKVIPVGVAIRQCFAALKRNEIVGILGDRDFSGENGINVDFLGKKLLAPRGPAVLSLRTQAAIVPAFVIRDDQDDRYFKYVFEKPIYPLRSDDEEHDIKDLTEKYIQVIEKYIRKYPQQWYMFNEFWKAEKVEIV